MSGSRNKENLSEGKKLLPVQFGQVGPDLDRVIVVSRQRDCLKFWLFILAGLFQDAGQTIMQRYQSAHAEWLSFLFLRNPFLELHCHPLEVVIGRIIGIRRSHCHGGSGERSLVRYPLYTAGAGGFWISTLERHAIKLCYFCTLRHSDNSATFSAGARVSQLPFVFVLNLQTARSFGLDVPPELLALADKVVE
jgi:hypothetical protein